MEKCEMPDDKPDDKSEQFESGKATAPPNSYYSLPSSASEEYLEFTATTSTDLLKQHSATISPSLEYSTSDFDNFPHQRTLASSSFISDYNNISDFHSYFSSTKIDSNNCSFQSSYNLSGYFTSPNIPFTSVSSLNNASFANLSNSDTNANISNLEFTDTCKNSFKDPEDFTIEEDSLSFQSFERLSSTISKLNLFSTGKQVHNSSNISLPPKCAQNKKTVDLCIEKKSKRNVEGSSKIFKAFKNEGLEELNKNGTKINNVQGASQELVADSLLHLLHKTNLQDSSSYDLDDISPVLVSLANKFKSEEILGLKKNDSNEDLKLMNELITKIILDKEEKKFKTLEEKKKFLGKETFDDLSNELNERKIKRDAMSHYQEDKNHKRTSNYGDYNQWEYFGQQDIQPSNNLSRRGHFSFGNASQQHSVGWNQMGIGIPRQANPYYSNPHSHVMPAHAHSDYRYNQWNNPNHKSIPNVHNAHSQNTVLPQTKVDMKHHAEISSSIQDFGIPIGSTSDLSKFRAASRDLMRRTPSGISEKSLRTTVRPDHLSPMSPGMRNSSIRTPHISSHSKTIINSPLSDLQILVTNQESENIPQKSDNFQQESVDLSAHSDISKQKDNLDEDTSSVNSKDMKDFRTSVSVIQIQNKQVKNDFGEVDKPVELTSKSSEKNNELDISPSPRVNKTDKKKVNSEQIVESIKENMQNEVKLSVDPVKTCVIVGKDEESSCNVKNEADVPKILQTSENKEKKENNTLEEHSNKSEAAHKGDEKHVEPDKLEKLNELSLKGTREDVESMKSGKRKAEDEQDSSVKKKIFMEVESQPHKTIDKIEDNADLPTVTSTSTDTKPAPNEIAKKTPKKKKPSWKLKIGRSPSGPSSCSERSHSCKKSRTSGSKEESRKKIKKSLCDVMDRRGPFLHILGSRESPASVSVVNSPKGDDEDEKDKSLVKKQTLNAIRTKHQNELDYRGRSRNGLYSSTLSARYDAHTTDYTWICVFCKKGPHYATMGDLFGPYIISEDENTSVCDFSGDEKDISDAQKRGGRNKKSLRSNNMVEHFQKMSKKLRRTHSTESCLTGMTVISDQVDQLRYEVWVHEQCAIWSPNVFLIGSRIIGMQEAIWCSVKTICSKCGISGANIGCVHRNCPNRSHYHCAKECGWSLQQKTFISTCHIHKPRS